MPPSNSRYTMKIHRYVVNVVSVNGEAADSPPVEHQQRALSLSFAGKGGFESGIFS